MTAVVEARGLVAEIAGPVRLGENIKAALGRVARLTGLGERRVRGFWNGEAKLVASEEMDRLRTAAARARADAELKVAAHADLDTLLRRIAACEAALRLQDQNGPGQVDHAAG